MSNPTSLDPVSVAAAVIGALIGQELAPVVGAYTVIMFAWLGGVLVGLYRRDPASRLSTAAFVVITFVLTVGGSVFAAELLTKHLGLAGSFPLFLAAFFIPAVGESWIDIAKWAIEQARVRLTKGQ